MIGVRLGRLDTAAARARLLEEPGDFVETAIPRHVGEAVAVERRPVRLGAGVEQDPHRFDVAFAHGQIDQRPVGSVPAAELGSRSSRRRKAGASPAVAAAIASRMSRSGLESSSLSVGTTALII